MAGDRVRAGEYAVRINAAADLVEAGVPVAEAARVLAGRFGCSVRQARRYAEQAARAGRAEVPQDTVVFTVKLPAGLAARVRAHARQAGLTHLRGGDPGAGGIPRPGSQEPSPQVNGRRVEAEFVFDRHAATDLSVAYAILVPQRRARTGRPGQEGHADDERGAVCTGLQRPAEEGPDHRVADRRRCGRTPRQLGLEVPEDWIFEDEGHSGATLLRPALERCGTWPPRAASMWCCATPRTGWPASSPTRRC